jgi:hypothetical protein
VRPLALRGEDPPDDSVVIVRGGEMKSDFVRRSARQSFDEFGFYGVSVWAALDRDVVALCASEPMLVRYGRIRLSTAGRLRALDFALVATMQRPHFDVVLPDTADATLERLEAAFDPPIPNPARAGQA